MKTAMVPQPRFGRAMSRLRTAHLKDHRRRAVNLIKEAVRQCKTVKRRTSKDAMWVRSANLKPIFDFLS